MQLCGFPFMSHSIFQNTQPVALPPADSFALGIVHRLPTRDRDLRDGEARAIPRAKILCDQSWPSDERSGLVAGVSRLELMSDGKDEDDVLGGKPTVFRDISVTAAREDEFPTTFFRRPPEQRMIG